MFPRYNQNSIFDVDNFFHSNVIDSNEDPNGIINRMNRLNTTTFPTYPFHHSWQPISRVTSHNTTPVHQNLSTNVHDQYRHETFRIRMTLPGYNREDIKTSIENGKLVVFARHVEWLGNDEDYAANEIKKFFFIPENCNFNEMKTNYDGQNFFINMPLKKSPRSRAASTSSYSRQSEPPYSSKGRRNEHPSLDHLDSISSERHGEHIGRASHRGSMTSLHQIGGSAGGVGRVGKRSKSESETFDFEDFFRSSFRPSIVDNPNGGKKLTMSLPLPNVSPDDINLSLRDSLLTLKINEKTSNVINEFTRQAADDHSTLHHVRSILLPPKTDLDELRSKLDNGVLFLEAPYKVD